MTHNRRMRVAVALVLAAGSVLVAASPATAVPRSASAEGGASVGWRQVSAGGNTTCGVRSTGQLFCWGADIFGKLGNGGADLDSATPTEVAGQATNWASVSTGNAHVCALKTNGRLFCWGHDTSGQLGNGTTTVTDQSIPTQVHGSLTTWAAVATGANHTCARRINGRLFCWGNDDHGELGDDATLLDRDVPVQVAGHTTDWKGFSTSAGAEHTCGRRSTGRLFCWGRDGNGQLGDDTNPLDQAVPAQVAGALTTWASVSAGELHTCGRRTNGRLFCWGANENSQLGTGLSDADQGTPVQVAGNRTDWVAVSAGGKGTCGRRASGSLFCWGNDVAGAVGNGLPEAEEPTPVEVVSGAPDWRSVSVGRSHTCAKRATTEVWCWGSDSSGQLGNGPPNTNQPAPVPVT